VSVSPRVPSSVPALFLLCATWTEEQERAIKTETQPNHLQSGENLLGGRWEQSGCAVTQETNPPQVSSHYGETGAQLCLEVLPFSLILSECSAQLIKVWKGAFMDTTRELQAWPWVTCSRPSLTTQECPLGRIRLHLSSTDLQVLSG
jgi:hypothetical protein